MRVRCSWPSLKRILQTVSMRQTLTRLKSSLTSTSSSESAAWISSYHTCTSTRRFRARSFRRHVRRDRLAWCRPTRTRSPQPAAPGASQELGDLAGALARKARVVAIDARELVGQRLIVGMTDEMQAHVAPVAQVVEHLAQRLDVALRNVREPESKRIGGTTSVSSPSPAARHGPAHLDTVARFLLHQVRIVSPGTQRLVARQLLSTASPRDDSTTSCACAERGQRSNQQQR